MSEWRPIDKYEWQDSDETHKVSAYVEGIKFHWVADSGNRETSGGGTPLARHFFKPRWQNHFKKIFNEDDFNEICERIRNEYELYQSK